MGRVAWVLVLVAAGCAERPGVCAESFIRDSVRFGFCYEVDGPGQCPVVESGDRGEFQWEFLEGGTCADLEYPFDCGGGLHEDIETECPAKD